MADFLSNHSPSQEMVFEKQRTVAQAFHVKENKIICPHCRHDHFKKDQLHIEQAFFRLVSVGCAKDNLYVLICENCTNIQWFCEEPECCC